MKTLTMYRPNTIQSALSDFDRQLESFFGDSILTPAARFLNHIPAVDVRDGEDAYLLEMELPGYEEKNIEVNMDGANLTIASKQEKTSEENEEKYVLHERKKNSFSRSFKLPENADPENVNAVFKNGVLSLKIMKRPEAQKKTIQINAA